MCQPCWKIHRELEVYKNYPDKMKLLIQLLALVSLVCAGIELSVRGTTDGINVVCHPGIGLLGNIFKYWRVCLPDNECIRKKHRNAGDRQKMSEGPVIMLNFQPVQSSDKTFVATVMYGNISTGITSGGTISLSCGVRLSGGLDWSHPVQISPQITGNPPTKNKTAPLNPGPAHPDNTSGPSESDAITAIPAKYIMFICITMAVVLILGLN